ncbi:ribonuclease P/MRP protein subunit POP5 [Methanomicrobium sp. W14]|uniref:Rpp14/Pop5 family protein n=1 Tax=Methanomicrobium sp. W14 TaxID=2817839 RepID=UPI001AE54FA2|nr:Rpp14/Pop5 family protein [Methanomicrobium sp. W14]MBP2132457.1 ribonuclease P/MRP protein subunit POP5 [Methanomicrobium sp. W14]
MKPLPPTLRVSKRYVLGLLVPFGTRPNGKDLYYALYDAVASLYGDKGAYEISMSVVFTDGDWFVMRCRRGQERRLETAAATVTRVGSADCKIRCTATSGTIATLKKKIPKKSAFDAMPDVRINESVYSVCRLSQEKVDLYREGIKHQDILYFTREDIEEL